MSKSFEGKTTQVEEWYKTKYNLNKISPEKIKVSSFVFSIVFYEPRWDRNLLRLLTFFEGERLI